MPNAENIFCVKCIINLMKYHMRRYDAFAKFVPSHAAGVFHSVAISHAQAYFTRSIRNEFY